MTITASVHCSSRVYLFQDGYKEKPNRHQAQSYLFHLFSQCISSHILSGLCKMSGYEVLRHGTSWSNYKSILKNGADPKYGGTTTEAADGPSPMVTHAKGKFYLFRDSEFALSYDGKKVLNCAQIPLIKRAGPIIHSYLANLSQYQLKARSVNSKITVAHVKAMAKAIFTPKLKFIYTLEEIKALKNNERFIEKDPDYGFEAAYRTSHFLSSDRIGLKGFITHFDKKHVWEHIKENPSKVVQGIAQVGLGILLTSVGLGYVS